MSDGEHSAFPTEARVRLRTLEAEDLDYLYRWENDTDVWQYGDCGFDPAVVAGRESQWGEEWLSPAGERFSRDALHLFIENQQHDISDTGQLRLVICRRDGAGTPVGFIDIFEIDLVLLRAEVGILICDPADRRKGYGREALVLAGEYARRILRLWELRCKVDAGNSASIALFTAAGFTLSDEPDDRPSPVDVGNPSRQGVVTMRKVLV